MGQREAQMEVVSQIIAEDAMDGSLIIAAGDMNDYAMSVCDINCDLPISMVETIGLNAGNLINAANGIQEISERYASWYDCENDCVVAMQCLSMIDHVLLSQELFDSITDLRIDHGFENGCATNYSDHWPYVITFDLGQGDVFNSSPMFS